MSSGRNSKGQFWALCPKQVKLVHGRVQRESSRSKASGAATQAGRSWLPAHLVIQRVGTSCISRRYLCTTVRLRIVQKPKIGRTRRSLRKTALHSTACLQAKNQAGRGYMCQSTSDQLLHQPLPGEQSNVESSCLFAFGVKATGFHTIGKARRIAWQVIRPIERI